MVIERERERKKERKIPRFWSLREKDKLMKRVKKPNKRRHRRREECL
jgi:hypothetical protein